MTSERGTALVIANVDHERCDGRLPLELDAIVVYAAASGPLRDRLPSFAVTIAWNASASTV